MIAAPFEDVVVTGVGQADLSREDDLKPILKSRKMRRFVGTWDRLAILAAADAVDSAGLSRELGESAGLFVTVGHVPVRDEAMDACLENSLDEQGRFDHARYMEGGYLNLDPLWVFHSLTNVPAFHVSTCFDVQGPYFVTYPEPGQFYLALDQAIQMLRDGRCQVALVGATSDLDNALVRYHYRRLEGTTDPDRLRSGAGFLVLERTAAAAARGAKVLAELREFEVGYRNFDPRETVFPHRESFEPPGPFGDAYWGPASLAMTLARAGAGSLVHTLESRDGIRASSRWEVRG